jgi:hypothetical protein
MTAYKVKDRKRLARATVGRHIEASGGGPSEALDPAGV